LAGLEFELDAFSLLLDFLLLLNALKRLLFEDLDLEDLDRDEEALLEFVDMEGLFMNPSAIL